ncbi:hypothetical protein GCM10027275_27490 [Rhabdobacter roseus]|uniref:Biotin carboxyl carrier protein n=1 Tax=Rhabdobacter roseus TaxID=1655419 RepID=A0A840TKH8_9BACT|nr:acetyl-CoA carboxylase biotin carboxyl carrier protein subunit [Rhabdobacter roseus]MBB5284696.1 biotin carboxyl carrier protein [Rhabdobacter roseus]
MLKVTVNESDTLQIRQEKKQWFIGDEPFGGDVVRLDDRRYHVIWNDRSFTVEVLETDAAAKQFTLRINGQLYTTSVQDRFDLLLESMGMSQAAGTKVNQVKAPMPGLIQTIRVQPGDPVQKGDTLLVLVAMKMENAIKAPADSVVKTIHVQPGDSVEKNQVLIEFV